MRTIRLTVGGARDPGGPGHRRIGLWLLTALAVPILIAAGAGYGVYHAFFRVPDSGPSSSRAAGSPEAPSSPWPTARWS